MKEGNPASASEHKIVDSNDIAALKIQIMNSGLTISQLVSTAWASASTFRASDDRGGANGALIRLEPQKSWEINNPEQLQKVLGKLEEIQHKFNHERNDGKLVSLADLIVLGGCAAVEKAIKNGGYDIEVPFVPGRVDVTQETADVDSSRILEPLADGFRNYRKSEDVDSPEKLLMKQAQLLTLTKQEMTALLGGMRVLDVNFGGSKDGVFTHRPEALTNDFFVNLLDSNIVWNETSAPDPEFMGRDRESGILLWTATRVDLLFCSNSELRAIADVYASADAGEVFVKDFIAVWNKVMNLDRFDLS